MLFEETHDSLIAVYVFQRTTEQNYIDDGKQPMK